MLLCTFISFPSAVPSFWLLHLILMNAREYTEWNLLIFLLPKTCLFVPLSLNCNMNFCCGMIALEETFFEINWLKIKEQLDSFPKQVLKIRAIWQIQVHKSRQGVTDLENIRYSHRGQYCIKYWLLQMNQLCVNLSFNAL